MDPIGWKNSDENLSKVFTSKCFNRGASLPVRRTQTGSVLAWIPVGSHRPEENRVIEAFENDRLLFWRMSNARILD